MRVILAAVAFSALSFAIGVAGDLTRPGPAHGQTVVVRIPPALPEDAARAAPLPLLGVSAASAAEPRRVARRAPRPAEAVVQVVPVMEESVSRPKPRADGLVLREPVKVDEAALAKAKERKQRQ